MLGQMLFVLLVLAIAFFVKYSFQFLFPFNHCAFPFSLLQLRQKVEGRAYFILLRLKVKQMTKLVEPETRGGSTHTYSYLPTSKKKKNYNPE
jgi:hypothetical protein